MRAVLTLLALLSVTFVAAGAAPKPSPTPTPNPVLANLSRLSGRVLDTAAMRELIPRFEEEIEIAYAATLNADHTPLLQWNQRMIERKSEHVKRMLSYLKDAGATPGRRGANVVTPAVEQMRKLRGGALERRYLTLMAERFDQNVAMADLAVQKGASQDVRTLARDVARIERQEASTLRGWFKEWYPK
jgi:uncharacterized protein (DUF305 family)